MGNWHISIQGTGVHHNADLPQDANRMALGFVTELKAAGHSIAVASFTYGATDDLSASGEALRPADILRSADIPGPSGDPGE